MSRTDKTTPAWVRELHALWADEINHDHRHGECVVYRPRGNVVGRRHANADEPCWFDATCHPESKSYYSMYERQYPRPVAFQWIADEGNRRARTQLRVAKHLAKQVRDFDEFEDWDLPGPRPRHEAAWYVW